MPPAQCVGLHATNTVQEETIGKLNIPAVLGYGVKTIVIGVIFYSIGATLILPFSFVEVFALATAYFYNALHANDYERLKVDSRVVYFESKYGRSFREENFLRSLTRVLPNDNNDLINISQGQRNILFGRNIHTRLRPSLTLEIKRVLAN